MWEAAYLCYYVENYLSKKYISIDNNPNIEENTILIHYIIVETFHMKVTYYNLAFILVYAETTVSTFQSLQEQLKHLTNTYLH